MRMHVAMFGLSLVGFSAGLYFVCLKAGVAIAAVIIGLAFVLDALRK